MTAQQRLFGAGGTVMVVQVFWLRETRLALNIVEDKAPEARAWFGVRGVCAGSV